MDDRVLVTGASGYIAAHVVDLLLKKGYRVRGTVRSKVKGDQILAKYPQYQEKLEIVIVADIAKEGAFVGALDGIDGVFHVASPFHYKMAVSPRVDYLDPAINGTVGILKTARKVPSVKRVIVTSSIAAIFDPIKGPSSYVYTENDWNPLTEKDAVNAFTAYCVSKTLAERAVYEFVENEKPHFDVVTLCPPSVIGPFVHHVEKLSELNESASRFYNYACGVKKVEDPTLDLFIDVRDLAIAHLLAYEKKEASNQRYFVTNGNFDWQEVVDVAHKYFADKTKADRGNPDVHPKPRWLGDNTKSKTHLGLVYRPKVDTFKDAIEQLIECQERGM